MKLTREQIQETKSLTSREAAKALGVGKTTVNKYRKMYTEQENKAWTPADKQELNGDSGLPLVSEQPVNGPQTHVSIEDDLEADGVTKDSHRLSYAYSEWDMADGTKGRSRRVTAVPVQAALTAEEVDPHELLRQVREVQGTTKTEPQLGGANTFVVSLNDWQYGKKTLQGGTQETIEIVTQSINNAKARVTQLTRAGYKFGELIVIFGGDLIEGCNNTPQGAFGIEMGLRQQIEGCVSLGLLAIDELAPMFNSVQVLAVRGNHGENRINNGKATTPEDNIDTLVVSMMREATRRDKNLEHVSYVIAEDEAGVFTKTLQGWSLGTTHGDVYGKGVSGSTVERKVNTWYKNMSAGRDPLGSVDVLITHHYHHSQSCDYGTWEWHQTPAQDGAMSEYFRQATGNFSAPGVLTFVMGEERFMESKVV